MSIIIKSTKYLISRKSAIRGSKSLLIGIIREGFIDRQPSELDEIDLNFTRESIEIKTPSKFEKEDVFGHQEVREE